MRHLVDGRKFGRNTSHGMAMFKNMATSLIKNEYMVTTAHKAKELRRVVDRLITLGKAGSLSAKRQAFSKTRDREVVLKLFSTLAERYSKRPGGYTRILRVDNTRWGDGAEMALIELVDRPIVEKKKKTSKKASAQHDHDHDHSEHDHAPAEKKKSHAAPARTKVSDASAKSKGTKVASVRKTPSKSGGGRSSSSS